MSVVVATNDRQHRRVRSAPALGPGGSWNGTAGSGGTAPAEDPTLRGSGWAHKAIGAFDEPRVTYLTGDLAITVGADHGDAAWLQEVMFWCEGTAVTVSQVSKNPRTGSIGFVITLDSTTFPADGDAQVYAYIRPVNGYERRIGPITVTRMADANRPVRYISPTGSDTNSGLTTGTAWKSILKASLSAPSGAIVYCAAGTYYEDSNVGTLNNNARPIEFRRAAGLNLGDVVLTQTALTPGGFWQPRAQNIIFDGMYIATETVSGFYGASPSGTYTFRNCQIIDRGGITSGYDTWPGVGQVQIGRQINTEAGQVPFRTNDGQQNCLLESTCAQYVTAGFNLLRNSTLQTAADVNYFGGPPTVPPAIFNTSAQQMVAEFEQRRHLAHTLTVATVSYTAGATTNPDGAAVPGKTTITWNESTTTFDTVSTGGQPSQNYRFLTGALAGQQFSIYSQSGNNTVLYGDCTAAVVGDSARGYIVWHADTLQLGSQGETVTNISNVFIQRYKSAGPELQVLWQAGGYTGQGTISTTGTALTCSTSHRLAIGDSVRVGTDYRTVASVTDATTAVLDGAFPSDLSAAAWRHGKALRNCAIQLSIFNKTSAALILHQWQHGHDHVVYRQNTLLGSPVSFRTDGTSNFGASGCIIVDSIIEAMQGGPAPTFGLTIDRNHLVEPTSAITGTNYTSGDPLLDSNYRPQSSAVRTTTPTILFNQLGEPISAGAKVGALG